MKKTLLIIMCTLILSPSFMLAGPGGSSQGGGGTSNTNPTNTSSQGGGGGGGTSTQTTTPNSNEVGINCTPNQLAQGQCSFSIYRTLGIKQDTNQDPTSVGLFVQDIILSLTFFIGTVLTVSLIYAGFLYIRSGVTGDDEKQGTAKTGIMYAFIGLLLVMGSYTIIRLVQFIVRGG